VTVRSVPLGELAVLVSGGTPDKTRKEFYEGGTVPWITSADIVDGRVCSPRTHVTALGIERSAASIAEPGTILLVTRTGVGKVALATYPLAFSQDVTAVAADAARVDAAYLAHLLRSRRGWLESRARGATIKGVSRAVVASMLIPLPSLDVQRQIARVLDAAEAVSRSRRRAIALTSDLPQAAFAASAESDTPRVTIGELCDVRGGKRLPKGARYAEVPTAYRYLRVTDFASGEIDVAALPSLTPEIQRRIARYTVAEGDIVISIAGSIGRVAWIPRDLAGANLTENAARLVARSPDRYDPAYLVAALRSPAVQAQIERLTGQVTIGKLALYRIEQIVVPLPELSEQRRFAALVARGEGALRSQRAQLVQLDALVASQRQRAFAGAL
jgi:restriction endonuclease S subunit